MLKSAIVGLGWWGQELIRRLQSSELIEVVSGFDVEPEAVAEFMQAHKVPLADTYESVLSDPSVEAVILTTPNGFHEQQLLQAVEAGKQIFCEKPLTLTAAAARRMIAACDQKDLIIGIGHERRFDGSLVELKRRVDEGELGTLLHLEFNASYNLFMGQEQTGWRYDPNQAPAGMMTGLGVHMTDYMQTLAGPVRELIAHSVHRSADYSSDDILSIHFSFESGVTATFTTLATTPFYQRLSVFGDRGWAEMQEVSNVDKLDPATLTWRDMDEEIHSRTFQWSDTVLQNLHEWAGAVLNGQSYRFTKQEILHNVEILEAIVTSIETGKPHAIGKDGPNQE